LPLLGLRQGGAAPAHYHRAQFCDGIGLVSVPAGEQANGFQLFVAERLIDGL
jgi:hypothetical protein